MVRADKQGPHRVAFERNKKRILKTKHICGICGKPVDKKLKYPDPMSPVIDHIIPISKGGHPSSIDNLQLSHMACNRDKSDKLYSGQTDTTETIGNRNLPKTLDWSSYAFKT
ncbi:MAG TPA: HNH endonuclease [Candidatus Jeotgalibaca pullicola]|nr:HNH endonuclease [Candidatus Jeotgalibaca pullicola]